MAQAGGSNGWDKCGDDAGEFYEGVGEDGVRAVEQGERLNRLIELRYARPDTGAVYSAEQMDALRTQSTLLSSTSRIVAVTSDDDGTVDNDDAHDGHEVWAYDVSGAEMLLTPGQDGNCDEGAKTAFRQWTTALDQSSTAGDVDGLTEPLPTLPGSFALPKHVRLESSSGGGCSFGYERRTIRVKPGNQWTPAVDTAQCSNPLLSTTEECTAANTWTDTVPAHCSDDSLTALGQAECEYVNTWNDAHAEGEKCTNDRASESECAGPNVWREPLWQSFCRVDPDTPAAATVLLLMSLCPQDPPSRVSLCPERHRCKR